MNILVTGRGGASGSWEIRGNQLGKAIGATVLPNAVDIGPYDVAVVVKRTPADLVRRIHAARVPLVFDVVDSWPQPDGNAWHRRQCVDWLRAKIGEVKPTGIVAATKAMAEDCAEFGIPVLTLPHHARSGIEANPIRESVRKVGYEGATHYLGRWRAVLDSECARRGWRFVVNPTCLAELDIVVALRDTDGYAPRHYKSGVKLSNAQASGTPFIGCREAGYLEQSVGQERWADTEAELVDALEELESQAARRRAAELMISAAPRLESVASTYSVWLKGVVCAESRKAAPGAEIRTGNRLFHAA